METCWLVGRSRDGYASAWFHHEFDALEDNAFGIDERPRGLGHDLLDVVPQSRRRPKLLVGIALDGAAVGCSAQGWYERVDEKSGRHAE